MSPAGAGRPRDPAIDSAVLAATVTALRDCGYFGFALEKTAAAAGTTKTAIRRRWPSRQKLVICALASVLVTPPIPDTGCTRCDLTRTVRLFAETLDEGLPRGVLAPLIADCQNDTDLHEHLMSVLVEPSRDAALAVIRRGVERGDLRPDVNPELLVDVLGSIVYRRALFGDPQIDRPAARQVVDVVLRGAAVDYDRLVRISQQPAHRHHES